MHSFEQRVTDGFINGTAMCVVHNKDISDWLKTDDTLELVVALSYDLGIEPNSAKSPNSVKTRVSAFYPTLVIVKRGSPETGGGTWLHPDLATQLAQWCSPAFAIQVSRWIREWMTTGQNPLNLQQDDIDRIVFRDTLRDEARLRMTSQVKVYLEPRATSQLQSPEGRKIAEVTENALQVLSQSREYLGNIKSIGEVDYNPAPPKRSERVVMRAQFKGRKKPLPYLDSGFL